MNTVRLVQFLAAELLFDSCIDLREFGPRADPASHDSTDYDTTDRRCRGRDTEAPVSSGGDICFYYSATNVASFPKIDDGSCRCLEETC